MHEGKHSELFLDLQFYGSADIAMDSTDPNKDHCGQGASASHDFTYSVYYSILRQVHISLDKIFDAHHHHAPSPHCMHLATHLRPNCSPVFPSPP